ncbi:hypothetical protein ACF0H5_002793 [Mactra antiquata]
MVKYTLTYFNVRGAGELSRLIFKLAKVDFEDKRVAGEEWTKLKPDMPMGALPVLEVDGVKICQSSAIARYLAREFGLVGSTNLESLRIDEAHEVFTEMFTGELTKIFQAAKDDKPKLAKEFVEGKLLKYLDFFEKRLKENKTGFYVGNKLTLGDLLIYHVLGLLETILKGVEMKLDLSKRDWLQKVKTNVESNPEIKKWLAERPQTAM